MTATTTDVQLPKFVQIKKHQELAINSSGFAEIETLTGNLLLRQGGTGISAYYNTSIENNIVRDNTIPRKHTSSIILDMTESVTLPEIHLIGNLPKEKTFLFPERQHNQEEIEEDFLRGVQPINHQHKILFTQEVKLKTSELRRWRPNIVVDPILFEDNE